MDLGQDSLVVCLHCCQSFCSRSIGSMKTSRTSSNTDFGNRVSASSLSTHSTCLVSFLWYSGSSAMTRFYLTCQGVEWLRGTPPIQLAKIVHRNTTQTHEARGIRAPHNTAQGLQSRHALTTPDAVSPLVQAPKTTVTRKTPHHVVTHPRRSSRTTCQKSCTFPLHFSSGIYHNKRPREE